MGRRKLAKRLCELCPELVASDLQKGWPSQFQITNSSATLNLDVWIGPVGLSHRRRDDVERRFQNPGSKRPISLRSGAVPLLLGVWENDPGIDVTAPVLVSADPTRRIGKKTRFSVFVGLDQLIEASTTGWAVSKNSDGETLYCLSPENLGRLIDIKRLQHGRKSGKKRPGVDPAIVADLALQGLTLAEIGEDVGVSRERVRQILRDQLPEIDAQRPELVAQARRRKQEQKKAHELEQFRQSLRLRGVDPDEVLASLATNRHVGSTVAQFDVTEEEVKTLAKASGVDLVFVGRSSTTAQRFSDEKCIEYLQLCARELKITTLSASQYNRFARRQQLTPEEWPSSQTVMKRLGGWRAACHAAGLDIGRGGRSEYVQDFPPPRCREFVDAYVLSAIQAGVQPTIRGYKEWARENAGPSVATVRNRLGPWSNELAASIARVDTTPQ